MIYLGSDHGGFDLKERIKRMLSNERFPFEDKGNTLYQAEDDYPVFAFRVGEAVAEDERTVRYPAPWNTRSKGLLFCRSAGGIIVAANKVIGIRAVAVWDVRGAVHAREHNDANIIALPGDWLEESMARDIITAFFGKEFTGEDRHKRRISEISEYEKLGKSVRQEA